MHLSRVHQKLLGREQNPWLWRGGGVPSMVALTINPRFRFVYRMEKAYIASTLDIKNLIILAKSRKTVKTLSKINISGGLMIRKIL